MKGSRMVSVLSSTAPGGCSPDSTESNCRSSTCCWPVETKTVLRGSARLPLPSSHLTSMFPVLQKSSYMATGEQKTQTSARFLCPNISFWILWLSFAFVMYFFFYLGCCRLTSISFTIGQIHTDMGHWQQNCLFLNWESFKLWHLLKAKMLLLKKAKTELSHFRTGLSENGVLQNTAFN